MSDFEEEEHPETPAIDRADHRVKAKLTMSGTEIVIGTYVHAGGDSLFIKLNELYEPIYFGYEEALMLVSVINACCADLEEK